LTRTLGSVRGAAGDGGPYRCARHDQQLGGASPPWRRWHQPQAKGNCVVVRRGGKEAGGEIATLGTHGASRSFAVGWAARMRRGGLGELAGYGEARCHQEAVT
jgi:hypothetical protein